MIWDKVCEETEYKRHLKPSKALKSHINFFTLTKCLKLPVNANFLIKYEDKSFMLSARIVLGFPFWMNQNEKKPKKNVSRVQDDKKVIDNRRFALFCYGLWNAAIFTEKHAI